MTANKRPGGGQLGNTNAMRNGTRANRTVYRLQLGELPKQMARVTRDARRYRRDLESVVEETYGEISVLNAHAIDEAAGFEMHAAICRWLLREKLEGMGSSDILACSKELAKARESRNRAVGRLGLEQSGDDVIKALYSEHRDEDAQALPAARSEPDAASETSDQQACVRSDSGASGAGHPEEGSEGD